MALAWEVTEEDIQEALSELGLNSDDSSIEEVKTYLDRDVVEKAALYGSSMEDQIKYAAESISAQIKKHSTVLEKTPLKNIVLKDVDNSVIHYARTNMSDTQINEALSAKECIDSFANLLNYAKSHGLEYELLNFEEIFIDNKEL